MMYVPELRGEPCDACGHRVHGWFLPMAPGFTGRGIAFAYGSGYCGFCICKIVAQKSASDIVTESLAKVFVNKLPFGPGSSPWGPEVFKNIGKFLRTGPRG